MNDDRLLIHNLGAISKEQDNPIHQKSEVDNISVIEELEESYLVRNDVNTDNYGNVNIDNYVSKILLYNF